MAPKVNLGQLLNEGIDISKLTIGYRDDPEDDGMDILCSVAADNGIFTLTELDPYGDFCETYSEEEFAKLAEDGIVYILA